MPIINPGTISANYIRMRHWGEHNYWYTPTCNVPKEVMEKVLSDDNTFLLACNEYEVDSSILYQLLDLGIPRKKIVLITEDADFTLANYWACGGEMSMTMQCRRFPEFKTLEKKEYLKSFLNFNRRWRIHRPFFVALLKSNNLLDKGFVSLGTSDDYQTWDLVFDKLIKLSDEEFRQLLTKHKNEIVQLPEMYLDSDNLVDSKDRIDNFNKIIELYQNSYFSVVSETYFFEDVGRFLTEKTFKSIGFKHPFILMAQPYSLKLLKNMGYKTFHPIIDESYDNEVDPIKRMKLIINEVERLSKMNTEQVHTFIDEVKEVVEHNFYTLLRKNQHIKKIG